MSNETHETRRIALLLGDASLVVAMAAPLLSLLAVSFIGVGPESYRTTAIGIVFYGVHALAVVLGVISLLQKVNACACFGIILGAFWPVATWIYAWICS